MENNKTIAQVVKDGLCTGCGTCVALCPEEAIEMVINEKKGIYVPKLDEEKCNDCGTCFKVCPGHEVDFKQLNLEIFGKEPEDILIGNYLNCYVGHSTDYDIRYNSSSGGLVTQLLIFMLEERLIDGALVTRMKKDKPLEPEPFIARTKEEIIAASKSKYCPVPANIALKEILEADEGERFAVIGLPCHIHGLRKTQRVNKKLRERVVVCLGIFCGAYSTFQGIEFLLRKINVSKNEIKSLTYRGEGWPGNLKLIDNKGAEKLIPYPVYSSFIGSSFFPLRCTLCIDATNEFSDISFGDAWLPEFANDSVGTSIFISRTSRGNDFLNCAFNRDSISLVLIPPNKLVESQTGLLQFKKHSYKAHAMFCTRLFKMRLPSYNYKFLQFGGSYSYANSFFLYLLIIMGKNKFFWGLLDATIRTESFIASKVRLLRKV